MKLFEENNCRLCPKTFCCEKCRIKHEETLHKIEETNCDICVYGRIIISDAPASLLNHIRSKHWPLHCILCKKVFNSLDDLVTHQKCLRTSEKTSLSPVTPSIAAEMKDCDPSPLTPATPFLTKLPQKEQHLIGLTITMGITSTPMQQFGNEMKITPLNQSEIKYVYKSSLKLTGSGSGNLTDSKKQDRRVTFSETPMTDVVRRSKILPSGINKYFPRISTVKRNTSNDDSNDSIDESFASAHEAFETPLDSEKTNSALVPYLKPHNILKSHSNSDNGSSKSQNTEDAIWESALTNVDSKNTIGVETSRDTSEIVDINKQFEKIEQVVCDNPEDISFDKYDTFDFDISSEISDANKSTGLWTSMTNIVKSVMSFASHNTSAKSLKRQQPDCDDIDTIEDVPRLKRMKITDIKCRRPIREISPLYQIRLGKPQMVDKATQTEDELFWY